MPEPQTNPTDSNWLPLIRAAMQAGETDVRAIVDRLARLAASAHQMEHARQSEPVWAKPPRQRAHVNGSSWDGPASPKVHKEVDR